MPLYGTDTTRASDMDREAVAALLAGHHEKGRLSIDEFKKRLDASFGASTLGELRALFRDLPESPSIEHGSRAASMDSALRAAILRRTASAELGSLPRPRPFSELSGPQKALRVFWIIWAVATSVNLVVWASVCVASGGLHYFWPAWVAGPLGAALCALTWFAQGARSSRTRRPM